MAVDTFEPGRIEALGVSGKNSGFLPKIGAFYKRVNTRLRFKWDNYPAPGGYRAWLLHSARSGPRRLTGRLAAQSAPSLRSVTLCALLRRRQPPRTSAAPRLAGRCGVRPALAHRALRASGLTLAAARLAQGGSAVLMPSVFLLARSVTPPAIAPRTLRSAQQEPRLRYVVPCFPAPCASHSLQCCRKLCALRIVPCPCAPAMLVSVRCGTCTLRNAAREARRIPKRTRAS